MKRLISLVLALIISLAISIPAFAAEPANSKEGSDKVTVMRAEETQWYYRVYNGQKQKRLWSITYGYWITAWMPYETPYP